VGDGAAGGARGPGHAAAAQTAAGAPAAGAGTLAPPSATAAAAATVVAMVVAMAGALGMAAALSHGLGMVGRARRRPSATVLAAGAAAAGAVEGTAAGGHWAGWVQLLSAAVAQHVGGCMHVSWLVLSLAEIGLCSRIPTPVSQFPILSVYFAFRASVCADMYCHALLLPCTAGLCTPQVPTPRAQGACAPCCQH
jgi:hypothetical protein